MLLFYFWLVALILLPLTAVAIQQFIPLRSADATRFPRFATAAIILSVAIASFAYRWIYGHGYGQTAALFIGIPTLLAIGTLFVPTRSAVGVAMKSVTVGICVSALFLNEGFLCILMSAPLFYAVALMIAGASHGLGDPDNRGRYLSSWVVLLAISPMSLEGVTPTTTVPREVTVTETRIIDATAAEVESAIFQPPRFDRRLPGYLRMGFPRPIATTIDGRTWIVRMRGGETRFNGTEPREGDLVLEQDASGDRFVSWRAVTDDSHMTHFLQWDASRVEWEPVDAVNTRVTWTLRYRRGLDPAWYFGPMERYATRLAASYLIDAVATP